jgi:hypothetical protein
MLAGSVGREWRGCRRPTANNIGTTRVDVKSVLLGSHIKSHQISLEIWIEIQLEISLKSLLCNTLFSIRRLDPLCLCTIFHLPTSSSPQIWAADTIFKLQIRVADTIFHLLTRSSLWIRMVDNPAIRSSLSLRNFSSADFILSADLSGGHNFQTVDQSGRHSFPSADLILVGMASRHVYAALAQTCSVMRAQPCTALGWSWNVQLVWNATMSYCFLGALFHVHCPIPIVPRV